MRRLKRILWFLCVLILPSPLLAQETLVFSAVQSSHLTPLLEQIVQEGYQQIGIQVEFKELPAERSLVEASNGRVDGELARTEFIEQSSTNLIRVPGRVYVLETMAFTKKGITIETWDSLKPYRLGTIIGHKQIAQNVQGMRYTSVLNTNQLFKMLSRDRVDVAVTGKINGLMAIKQFQLNDVAISGPPLSTLNLYHYLHERNKHFVPQITAVFAEMERSGRIRQISEQFEASIKRAIDS